MSTCKKANLQICHESRLFSWRIVIFRLAKSDLSKAGANARPAVSVGTRQHIRPLIPDICPGAASQSADLSRRQRQLEPFCQGWTSSYCHIFQGGGCRGTNGHDDTRLRSSPGCRLFAIIVRRPVLGYMYHSISWTRTKSEKAVVGGGRRGAWRGDNHEKCAVISTYGCHRCSRGHGKNA